MTTAQQLLQDAAGGDAAALDWLVKFSAYAHALDDLVDADRGWPRVLALPGMLRDVVQHPFYLRHAPALSLVIEVVEAHYAASVVWERDERLGRHRLADVLRCCGNLAVAAVAVITGGRALAQRVVPALWEESWREHHDADGQPV